MKKRIDRLLFEKGLAPSRNAAVALIQSGRIRVQNNIVTKNSVLVEETEIPEIIGNEVPYVGRGGLKLEKALKEFKVDPMGLTVIDVGSSTGGFTDCLLRQGAKKVYAIDVGTKQLVDKLKSDQRVVSLEQTDIRDVQRLPEKPDLAVIDVSFISLEKILMAVSTLITITGKMIVLVKPQFETAKEDKNRKGIVADVNTRRLVLERIKKYCEKNSLKVLSETISPVLGGSGNEEYLLLLQKIKGVIIKE